MSPHPLYTAIARWLNTFIRGWHATTSNCLSLGVFCVLLAQSLRAADRARAVPPQHPGSARARLQRNQRLSNLSVLSPTKLTPLLIRMALQLFLAEQTPVPILLDTTRIICWEVFYAALPFKGRTLPICWLVIPYPWPKNAFRKAVNELLDLLHQNWPTDRKYMIVADRGFPSQDLFQRCHHANQDWNVRLRCSSPVIYQGQKVRADSFVSQVPNGQFQCFPVTYYAKYAHSDTIKKSQPVPGYLLVGHQEAEPPPHKQGPASRAAIAKQRQARQTRSRNKRIQRGENPPSAAVERASLYWLLFTSSASPNQTVTLYRQRMLIEQTFRDWKSGWDLVGAIKQLTSPAHVSSLMGLTLLAYRLQIEIGVWVAETTEPIESVRRDQWTVTGRMSLFWQAAQALSDNVHHWSPWLVSRIDQYYPIRDRQEVHSSLAA